MFWGVGCACLFFCQNPNFDGESTNKIVKFVTGHWLGWFCWLWTSSKIPMFFSLVISLTRNSFPPLVPDSTRRVTNAIAAASVQTNSSGTQSVTSHVITQERFKQFLSTKQGMELTDEEVSELIQVSHISSFNTIIYSLPFLTEVLFLKVNTCYWHWKESITIFKTVKLQFTIWLLLFLLLKRFVPFKIVAKGYHIF